MAAWQFVSNCGHSACKLLGEILHGPVKGMGHGAGELNPCHLMPVLSLKWEHDKHCCHPGVYFKVEGCRLHIIREHLFFSLNSAFIN